CQQYYDLLPTF
nr:immunoglobulin light chain junction region [Macaca mulatta]MOX97467.1 immunoglobulin light chain junction region [Macaca mulatta]MOX97546.1 immunoglobulin light chain junction region [Macaca mulatta]MOX97808.1 immunoglobulin light chain junction region [Macaca mulatta]MOX98585.1 immunoglobulin light chain junction region [Macaca mulatta]